MREPSPESLAETAPPQMELETGETIATTPGARAAATGGFGGGERDLTLAPGARIGRYVLLTRLGAGAMGVVLAAYDPELDRKVALELLKHRGAEEDAARTRLQREAQALVKLGHPNVVAVHDVGVHQGQLFVGMEFVEGETLGEWIGRAARPRPWQEVLQVFEAAGLGLAAAHRAGLIHRDFKPEKSSPPHGHLGGRRGPCSSSLLHLFCRCPEPGPYRANAACTSAIPRPVRRPPWASMSSTPRKDAARERARLLLHASGCSTAATRGRARRTAPDSRRRPSSTGSWRSRSRRASMTCSVTAESCRRSWWTSSAAF